MNDDLAMPSSLAPDHEAELCLACGLCCVGIVHSHASLDADELELAQEFDLRVDMFEDGLGFHLPCPQYRADRCSVYQRRPRACVNYACELLMRYRQGEVTGAESLSLVTQARAKMETLRAQLPGGSTTPITFTRLRQIIDEQQRA